MRILWGPDVILGEHVHSIVNSEAGWGLTYFDVLSSLLRSSTLYLRHRSNTLVGGFDVVLYELVGYRAGEVGIRA